MEKYNEILKNSNIFSGMNDEEIESILSCLSAVSKTYPKNSFIFSSGDKISSAGLVLSGSVHIIKEDYWGNRAILARCDAGSLFGEVYAVLRHEPVGVSAIADEESKVLFLEIQRVMTMCSKSCAFHNRLIHNLITDMAGKNLALTRKIEHMSHRTTREKLMSYLSEQALLNSKSEFLIPFNRQQLSDYLSVDRSAMSKELCNMRDDGLLEFDRSWFKLHQRF